MENRDRVTETIKASEARKQWGSLLNAVSRSEKRVIVEKNGLPVAAIVSMFALNRLERFERRQSQRLRILEEVGELFQDVSDEELEREMANAVRQAREEKQRIDQNRQELAQVLERMREPFKDVPPEEIEREVAKAIEEVRKERREQARRSA